MRRRATRHRSAPAKVKGKLAAFTKMVTDQDMFKSQLKNLNIDTEKMPLGDISEQTIEKGFTALLEVEAEVNGAGRRGHAR